MIHSPSLSIPPGPSGTSRGAAWWGLAVLIALGLYTYMDRQVIGLQAEPIRQDLGLDDTGFAMIQGLSVALLTVLAGYPIAWLADRFDRRRVLAACLLVWCMAVTLCGAATSFQGLFLASALVGAAEAGLLPIAYSQIPEWFGHRGRQVANSTFVLLGRLAVGVVIAACGWLIYSIDAWRAHLPAALQGMPTWRLALFATGIAGLLLLPLILVLPRMPHMAAAEPRRFDSSTAALPLLRGQVAVFVPLYLAAGLLAFGASAVGTFVPVAAARVFGATPLAAGQGLGAAAFGGALVALAITTLLARSTPLTYRPDVALRSAAWAMAFSTATAPTLLLADGGGAFFALYGVHLAGVMTAVMLLPTALQALCPAALRARLMSIYVTANVVLGACGPLAVGALSDAAPGALVVAMVAVAAPAHVLATALLRVCARRCAMQATIALPRPGPIGD